MTNHFNYTLTLKQKNPTNNTKGDEINTQITNMGLNKTLYFIQIIGTKMMTNITCLTGNE